MTWREQRSFSLLTLPLSSPETCWWWMGDKRPRTVERHHEHSAYTRPIFALRRAAVSRQDSRGMWTRAVYIFAIGGARGPSRGCSPHSQRKDVRTGRFLEPGLPQAAGGVFRRPASRRRAASAEYSACSRRAGLHSE